MAKRLKPNDRKELILASAVHVAERDGFQNLTRDNIATHAEVAPGLVSKYLGTMCQLKRSVMRRAVRDQVHEIVAYGLVTKDPHALKAPEAVRRQAMQATGQPT